jgi:deazaflavin-dependent oxidoreductase (nitroreductase family)
MASTHPSSMQKAPAGGIRAVTHLFNPLAMLLAGTRLFPLYAVLEHRGRRSGKLFRTPVVARKVDDGFIVPMPWGEGTDWYRNVRAARQATIRWKGRTYPVDHPEVLEGDASRASFSRFQQGGMTRFGIRQVLHLHHST